MEILSKASHLGCAVASYGHCGEQIKYWEMALSKVANLRRPVIHWQIDVDMRHTPVKPNAFLLRFSILSGTIKML